MPNFCVDHDVITSEYPQKCAAVRAISWKNLISQIREEWLVCPEMSDYSSEMYRQVNRLACAGSK